MKKVVLYPEELGTAMGQGVCSTYISGEGSLRLVDFQWHYYRRISAHLKTFPLLISGYRYRNSFGQKRRQELCFGVCNKTIRVMQVVCQDRRSASTSDHEAPFQAIVPIIVPNSELRNQSKQALVRDKPSEKTLDLGLELLIQTRMIQEPLL